MAKVHHQRYSKSQIILHLIVSLDSKQRLSDVVFGVPYM